MRTDRSPSVKTNERVSNDNSGIFNLSMSSFGSEAGTDFQHSAGQLEITTGSGYINYNNNFQLSGTNGFGSRPNFQLSAARQSGTVTAAGNEHNKGSEKRSFAFSDNRGRGSAISVKSDRRLMYQVLQNNEVEGASMAGQTPYNQGENERPPVPRAEVGMMRVNSKTTFGRRIQLRENGHGQPHQLAYGNIAQNNNATQGNRNVAPVMCNYQEHTGNMVDMVKIFRDFAACIDKFADNLEQNYHH